MGISIKSFVSVAKLLPANISVLVQGDHGIGKSQIVAGIAKHFNLELIDIRLGQKDVGDITGLPRMNTDANTTEWFSADWVKAACERPCLIFFDEMNRGTVEVLQAVFEAVLDRRLGWKNNFHPETRVYAAINVDNKYSVNDLDPAKRDRFAMFDLEPDVKDWLDWGTNEGEVAYEVLEFIRQNQEHLDHKGSFEPTKKYPSRRSWDRLSRVLSSNNMLETPDQDVFYQTSMAFVGVSTAQAFQSFVVSMEKKVNIEDVVADWPKAKKRLGKNIPNDTFVSLGDKMIKLYSERVFDQKECDNTIMFMKDCPVEVFMNVWQGITAQWNNFNTAADGTTDKKAMLEKLGGKQRVQNIKYITVAIRDRISSVVHSDATPEQKITKEA